MTDLNTLLNEAESAQNLKDAQVQGRIEVARLLVHETLPQSVWDVLGITKDTPRSRVNPLSWPDQAGYGIRGAVTLEGNSYPFEVDVQIGKNCEPSWISAYFPDSTIPIGLLASTPLLLATDLTSDNGAIQKENQSRIAGMLRDAQQRILASK